MVEPGVMTDIIVLDTGAAVLWTSVLVVVVPGLMMGAYLMGRYAAWRWYQKNAHELAEAETRQRYKDLIAQTAELHREVDRQAKRAEAGKVRLREVVAAVRAAQVQTSKQAELLTLAAEVDE